MKTRRTASRGSGRQNVVLQEVGWVGGWEDGREGGIRGVGGGGVGKMEEVQKRVKRGGRRKKDHVDEGKREDGRSEKVGGRRKEGRRRKMGGEKKTTKDSFSLLVPLFSETRTNVASEG